MMPMFGFGRGWGRGFGRGRRGYCWQYLYQLLKERGKEDEFEKYLMSPKPCWLIVQELLNSKD